MTIYGYARVSSNGQSLEAQLAELKAAGCEKVFQEKISGKNRERAQLESALKKLGEGDMLIITRLDRLARSSKDLLNVIAEITAAGASFKSLKETWADTSNAHGRLMLTILSGIAEFERELIVGRTSEGRTRALEKGVVFGRRPKLSHYQRAEALKRREAGEPIRAIAQSYGVHHSQISRLA